MSDTVQQHLTAWICDRLDDPDTVRWFAKKQVIRLALADLIERNIFSRTGIPDLYVRAWRALIKASRDASPSADNGYFLLEQRLAKALIGHQKGNEIANFFTPRISVRPTISFEKTVAPNRARDLVSVDIAVPDWPPPNELLEKVTGDSEALFALLRRSTQRLNDALDFIEETVGLDFDHISYSIPSIADHGQNQYRTGAYLLVRLMADAWAELSELKTDSAKAIADEWSRSNHLLFRRLWLHALSFRGVFSAETCVSAISELNDDDFWGSPLRRELMRMIVERWSDLGTSARVSIEKRIIQGPARSLFRPETEDAEYRRIRDHEAFQRLMRIRQSTDSKLSDHVEGFLNSIRAEHPEWITPEGDRSDFSTWVSEVRDTPLGNADVFDSLDDEQILAKAAELQESFEEEGAWRIYVQKNPSLALNALLHQVRGGVPDARLWRDFFNVWTAALRDEKSPSEAGGENVSDIDHLLLTAILEIPATTLAAIGVTICHWLSLRQKTLENSEAFWQAWDKMWSVAESTDTAASGDRELLQTAINRISGQLTEILIRACGDRELKKSSRVPTDLKRRFENILEASSESGRLARSVLAPSAPYLHYIDPIWTRRNLGPFFQWENVEARDFWEAYVYARHIGDPSFFRVIQQGFFQAIKDTNLNRGAQQHLAEQLMLMLITRRTGTHWSITDAQAKSALRTGGDDFRQRATWYLWRWFAGQKSEQLASAWAKVVRPILMRCWPPDVECRTPEVARNLAELPLEAGAFFEDVVGTIEPFLTPSQHSGLIVHQMLNDKLEIVKAHAPSALRLLAQLVDTSGSTAPYGLRRLLTVLSDLNPETASNPDWRDLDALCLRSGNEVI